jgi:SHS2 domain-containing protein
MKRFKVLDHTADIGLIVYGEDLKALFENAGEAFFHLMTDLRKVRSRTERRIEIQGEILERLMVDWLTELLYLHDVENLLFKKFKVKSIGEAGLTFSGRGSCDQDRGKGCDLPSDRSPERERGLESPNHLRSLIDL